MMIFFKIILYFIFILLVYFWAKKYEKKGKKIPLFVKIFICFLYVGYLFIATAYPFVMDKQLYALKFSSDIYLSQVYNDSLGLGLLTDFLHLFTYNPMILFSVVSFIYMFLTLIAYDKVKDADSFALLLLLLSEFPTFGFYQIKQCLALAAVNLGLAYYINNNKFKAFLLFVIGIIFHETSLIIIPMILIIKGSKNKFFRFLEYLFLIIVCVFFGDISKIILNFISIILPSVYSNWGIYLNNNYLITNLNLLTILKGLPFYFMIIFFFMFEKKINLSKSDNIDKYLTLSIINCFFIVLSGYMYWMFRFGTYFYFFNCILGSIVYRSLKRSFNKKIYLLSVVGLFVFLGIKLWMQYYLIYGGL